MRNKKVFFILPAVFFVLLVVALGCLNSKPNTLEFYLMDSGKKDVFEYLTQKFSAETKNRYKIEILTAADSRQYLRARIERKDIPDVIAMDGNSIYTELAEGGYLMNLEKEKFIKSINEHYINMLYQINGSKGREILGIPYAVNASGLMYNKAIFEKYGLTPPETWSELIDVCAVLKNAGIPAFAMSFGENWTSLPVWNNIVPVIVPDSFIEQKNSGNTSFLQTHREVLEKYAALLNYTKGTDAISAVYLDAVKDFANGRIAMMVNGIWTVPLIKRANPDAKIDTIVFPSCDLELKNTVNSGIDIVLTISKDSEKKRIAKKFVQFLLRPENSQIYIDRHYSFSTVNGVTQNDPSFAGLIEIMKEGRISDFPDHYYPAGFDLASILTDFARNKEKRIPDEKNITATLARCDSEYEQCLKLR